MIFQCTALTKKGVRCTRTTKTKGDRCYQHPLKKDYTITKLLNENSVLDIDKFFQYTELNQEICGQKICKEYEEWKSMKDCGFSYYVLSSLGRCYNLEDKRFLTGFDTHAEKYRGYNLTSDKRKHYHKGIHTWQGIVFYGLPFLENDFDQKDNAITMDHINPNKTKVNTLCCNVRPATRNQQNQNQRKRTNTQGRVVVRCTPEGKTDCEFSSVQAAADKVGVHSKVISKRCNNGKMLKGYTFRYKVKADFGDLEWKSTDKLFPDNDVFEISEEGHVCRKDGRINKGTKNNKYLITSWFNKRTKKSFEKSMNVLTWEVFHGELVGAGFDIHHEDNEPLNNNIKNLYRVTRSVNSQASKDTGKNKGCKKVRRIAHDDTYRDFISLAEAAENTFKAHATSIGKCLRGKLKTSGNCKCGKKFTWTVPK